MMERVLHYVFSKIDKIYIILFFVSFFHSALSALFMLSLFFYCRYGIEGGVKALLLLTTRGIMSSAVAAPLNGTIKWIVLIGISVWIILHANVYQENKSKVNNVLLALFCFVVMVSIGTFIVSSYPVTSIFKMISFSLSFAAVLFGLASTSKKCRWSDFFAALFLMLFAISLLLIPFAKFRIVNDNFQGIFNHVNMLGMISSIFVAIFLESSLFKKRKYIRILVIVSVLFMTYLSASRTGMFTALALICAYIFCTKSFIKTKVGMTVLFILFSVFSLMVIDSGIAIDIRESILEFIWKDHADNLFASRQELIDYAKFRYENNKLTGTGFLVPYIEGIKNYSLDFNLLVEPGNMIYMLLGDTGIIGIVFFIVFFLTILRNGSWTRIHLLVGAFMINMGEMVFFSSNNMSILLYFMIGVYMFVDNDDVIEYS